MQIVFDTDCVLCSAWVHFLLRHERDETLRFVSAWSDTGLALAAAHGLNRADLDRTFLVIEGSRGLTRSDAVLALLGRLRAPWRWLACFAVLPRSLLDVVYDVVARNRYRWFGRKPQCFLPPPKTRHRFVDK